MTMKQVFKKKNIILNTHDYFENIASKEKIMDMALK